MSFIDKRLQRLDELQRQRPQFAELLSFFQALYRFFQEQDSPLLELKPDLAGAARRIENGFPLLDADSLVFDPARLQPFLTGLVAILYEHGRQGQEELECLRQALENNRLQTAELLRASFERRREPLVHCANELKIEPAILAYVLDMTLSYALRGAVEKLNLHPPEHWQEGVCPTCGGLPSMGELSGEEGVRRLHCGSCGTDWTFPRQTCPFCGNQEKKEKEYFTAGDERGYRVDLCRACNCYLKIVDGRELGQGLPMDIEDAATLYLDILAQREGFTQGKTPFA